MFDTCFLVLLGHFRRQEGCTLAAQSIWEAEVMVFCTSDSSDSSDTDHFGVDLKRHCGKYIENIMKTC